MLFHCAVNYVESSLYFRNNTANRPQPERRLPCYSLYRSQKYETLYDQISGNMQSSVATDRSRVRTLTITPLRNNSEYVVHTFPQRF